MRKTHLILQHLDTCDGDEHVEAIAAAIGMDGDNAGYLVSSLCSYLKKQGHVTAGATRGEWHISPAGSEWIRNLAAEDNEPDAKPTRTVHKRPEPQRPGVRRRHSKLEAPSAPAISAPLRKANGHAAAAAVAIGVKAMPPIEHGVPVPPAVRSGAYRELAQQMQVGDSVRFENDSKASNLRVALRALGFKSVQRQGKDGCRVWRIA